MNNPYLNALLAFAYIGCVALFMQNVPATLGPKVPILMIMVMISILVLSVALMGFLFFYRPLQMYFGDQKEQVLPFFIKTITTFASLIIVTLLSVAFLF